MQRYPVLTLMLFYQPTVCHNAEDSYLPNMYCCLHTAVNYIRFKFITMVN